MDKDSFGGSTESLATETDATGWRSRPALAALIRLAIFVVPIVSAVLLVRSVAVALPAPSGLGGWSLWLFCTGTIAVATVTLVDRLARRALPLVALFKMSLIFPDETPSRMRLALRTRTARDLERQLAAGGSLGQTADEAATNLLVLLGQLNKHDRLTRGHSERVRAYSDLIAEEMQLSKGDREHLHWGALAHDLGKLAVPPEILNSPERPSKEEWEVLRNHPAAAAAITDPLRPWLGDWLNAATEHHERWDGRGYPAGVSGTDIHLSGRIVAVADAFDTMTSARSYKKPLPFADARAELTRNAGSQFDPTVVRAFMSVGVSRVRLVAGPLAWLSSLPTVTGLTSVATGTAAGAASSLVGAALVVTTSIGLAVSAPEDAPDLAAQLPFEQVTLVVENDQPSSTNEEAAGDRATAEAEVTTTTMSATSPTTQPAQLTTTTGEPPASTTTVAPSSTASSTTAAPSSTASPTTTTTTTAAPDQGADCADVQGGQRPLSELDLFNCDLSGLDLANQDLNDADLDGANLAGANLSGATMTDGDFEGVNFTSANLTGADMRFSNWDDSNFTNAALGGVNLSESEAEFVDFTGADMTAAVLGDTDIRGANFTNTDLTGATGQPNDGPLATWSNTTCSNGVVQSTSCYA